MLKKKKQLTIFPAVKTLKKSNKNREKKYVLLANKLPERKKYYFDFYVTCHCNVINCETALKFRYFNYSKGKETTHF